MKNLLSALAATALTQVFASVADASASVWPKADLAANLVQPLTIQLVRIEEADKERVQRIEFQYRDGAKWKTIYTGTKIGRWHQQKLDPPVKAQEFRLNILDATDGPSIADIELIEK